MVNDTTLVEILRRRAHDDGTRVAYTFLVDGDRSELTMTYGELEVRARRIAVALAARENAGDPVLLVFEPGLDFVAAVFGCFFAGATAVPVFPPEPRDVAGGIERLRRIAVDAGASIALTTGTMRAWLAGPSAAASLAGVFEWCVTDALPKGSEDDWSDPGLDREQIAFLQYTSGSTGDPRGVMVTHGNLLAHGEGVGTALALTPESVVVSWLPLFHDMGLVGTVLIPMQVGFRSVLLSPLAFLEHPLRWVQALSRYGGTLSPAPNFAYELVVRRSTPEERATLDLGRWAAALNGAEPVRADVCERFAEAFATSGFRREAFVPCYGLAEATLMVAGGPIGTVATTLVLDAAALERHQVVPSAPDAAGARVVSGCGRPTPGLEVAIVDSNAGVPVSSGTVGEIWVSGPQVAAGYWHRPEETAATFRASVGGSMPAAYLRTGDLGFLHEGTLFVTGRRKDLIVVRGRNFYPQDIEHTAETAHSLLRSGGAAAFAVSDDGGTRVVIVQEAHHAESAALDVAARAVRDAVAREHGLQLHAVVLIPARRLPKTSSGKVQRRACREAFAADRLPIVASWWADGRGETTASVEKNPAVRAIETWLVSAVARVRDVAPDRIHVDDPWVVLGIDSAEAAELGAELSDWLGRSIPLRTLMQHRTLRALAAALHEAGQ